MAETVGSLIDKLSIIGLKIYHMQEQVDRPDAAEDHKQLCRERVQVLKRQRGDLVEELDRLTLAWTEKRWTPKVYRQFKMYNDPKFRIKQRA